MDKDEIISNIRPYCRKNGEILMAFLFGSHAAGRACKESDIDIALYLSNGKGRAAEIQIHNELERILKKEIELVNLNRCFATLSWNIIRKGVPIVIKDRRLYLDFMLDCSGEAVDFIDFNLDAYRRKNAAAERR